jgi:hypothetical protein
MMILQTMVCRKLLKEKTLESSKGEGVRLEGEDRKH